VTKKNKNILTIIVTIIYISICIFKLEMYMNKYVTDEKSKTLEVFVVEKLTETEDNKKVSYLVKLKEGKSYKDQFILNICINQYAKVGELKQSVQSIKNIKSIEEHTKYVYGDILELTGKKMIPEALGNPYEFNYRKYLNSKNIYGTIVSYNVVEKTGVKKGVLKPIYDLREYISNLMEKSMSKENAALLKSMIYGDKRELTDETKKTFELTGTSHILTASGTNIATVVIIASFFMTKARLNKYIRVIVISICVFAFMAFAGFDHSIFRAGLSVIIALFLSCINKNMSPFEKLLLIFAIMFFINPTVIFSTGATLSFLATLGILIFYQKIMMKFEYIFRIRLREKKNKNKNKNLRLILSITAITIAVQITILPMQIASFNSYSLITLPANIVAGIVSDIIRLTGTLGIAVSFIPKVAMLVFKITEPAIIFFNIILKLFEKVAVNIKLATPSIAVMVTYYLYILGIFLEENLVVKNYNQGRWFYKQVKKAKKILIYIFLAFFIFSTIYTTFFDNYIYFFNVRQGDMSFVSYKGSNILIDAGSTTEKLAFNVLDTFLKKKNIKRIDLVVISHFHLDHVNGLEEIIQKYEVKCIAFATPKECIGEYTRFKTYMRDSNIRELMLERGDKLQIGKVNLDIYSPKETGIDDSDIQNANSIVFQMNIEDKRILYMGDASAKTEEDILNYIKNVKEIKNTNEEVLKNVSVLKVGHHGSKTSSSAEFLKEALPNIAVISCGKTIYGHPHKQTLEMLKRYGAATYVTRFNGSVKVKI